MMPTTFILAALVLAIGVASEAEGPRNVPLRPAELGIHHLLIPGTINIMAEAGGGQSSMVTERRTVQVHVFVKAKFSNAHTSLKGLLFVGESPVAQSLCCMSDMRRTDHALHALGWIIIQHTCHIVHTSKY